MLDEWEWQRVPHPRRLESRIPHLAESRILRCSAVLLLYLLKELRDRGDFKISDWMTMRQARLVLRADLVAIVILQSYCFIANPYPFIHI